jgi:hypothetical protein
VRLKQAGEIKRCGIYHNMQLALEWLESNRAVMDEAHVKEGWFSPIQMVPSLTRSSTCLLVLIKQLRLAFEMAFEL